MGNIQEILQIVNEIVQLIRFMALPIILMKTFVNTEEIIKGLDLIKRLLLIDNMMNCKIFKIFCISC